MYQQKHWNLYYISPEVHWSPIPCFPSIEQYVMLESLLSSLYFLPSQLPSSECPWSHMKGCHGSAGCCTRKAKECGWRARNTSQELFEQFNLHLCRLWSLFEQFVQQLSYKHLLYHTALYFLSGRKWSHRHWVGRYALHSKCALIGLLDVNWWSLAIRFNCKRSSICIVYPITLRFLSIMRQGYNKITTTLWKEISYVQDWDYGIIS